MKLEAAAKREASDAKGERVLVPLVCAMRSHVGLLGKAILWGMLLSVKYRGMLIGKAIRVKASITKHLRDFAPDLEKYRRCKKFPV